MPLKRWETIQVSLLKLSHEIPTMNGRWPIGPPYNVSHSDPLSQLHPESSLMKRLESGKNGLPEHCH